MDTVATLYDKYQQSLAFDIQGGCTAASMQTQILLAFYQEVVYRQSGNVNDQVTANQLLAYTYQNYS
jgi:flagellar biosynthesis chaperone FliJ